MLTKWAMKDADEVCYEKIVLLNDNAYSVS
jgi:hypothetical protein